MAPRDRAYRQVLAAEPNSVEIHERLAPLLAATRQDFDAWNSYRAVAHAALREGREDRAIAVFREAAHALPQESRPGRGSRGCSCGSRSPTPRSRCCSRAAAIPLAVASPAGDPSVAACAHRPVALRDRARARAPSRPRRPADRGVDVARRARRALSGAAAAPRPRGGGAVAPGARSLWRWLTSWRGRGERLLELALCPPPRSGSGRSRP